MNILYKNKVCKYSPIFRFAITDITVNNIVILDYVKDVYNLLFIVTSKNSISEDGVVYALDKDSIRSKLIYDNNNGCYRFRDELSKESALDLCLKEHYIVKKCENFPYLTTREYESLNIIDRFQDHEVIKNELEYNLGISYTFGLEFETSLGYVPNEKCFENGLIPLHDGSISGIEYASIVMKGDKGLNLLKQQTELLKRYTYFNKECSLHIHFGGFPVDSQKIFNLARLWVSVQNEIEQLIPPASFYTSKFKKTGKDYCKKFQFFDNFNDMYTDLSGGWEYYGSLYQMHPSDYDRSHKWNVQGRYYNMNLINMLFYKSPKTIEFRFLRPTYNFNKIVGWLLILNAILFYANNYYNEKDIIPSLKRILECVYPVYMYNKLIYFIKLLNVSKNTYYNNGDIAGQNTCIEDDLLNDVLFHNRNFWNRENAQNKNSKKAYK